MYLNDHQRKAFYGALGLDSTIFNQHVIVETNRTTARVFPAVPDVEHPDFFPKMDQLVKLNSQLVEVGQSEMPDAVKGLQRVPIVLQMLTIIVDIYFMKPIDSGSWDFKNEAQLAF